MQIEQVSLGAEAHLPLIQALVRREKAKTSKQGWRAGQKAGKRWGFGLEFAEIRNYVAGDDVRHINWRASSRSQKMMTKVFIEDSDARVLVLVDLMGHMYFGTSKRLCSVMAVYLAAMLTNSLLVRSLHVSICWIDAHKAVIGKPTNNRSLAVKKLLHMGQSHNAQLSNLKVRHPNNIDKLESHIRPALFNAYSHAFIISSPYSNLKQLTCQQQSSKSKVHHIEIYDPQLLKANTHFRNFSNRETNIAADQLIDIDITTDISFGNNLSLAEADSKINRMLERRL